MHCGPSEGNQNNRPCAFQQGCGVSGTMQEAAPGSTLEAPFDQHTAVMPTNGAIDDARTLGRRNLSDHPHGRMPVDDAVLRKMEQAGRETTFWQLTLLLDLLPTELQIWCGGRGKFAVPKHVFRTDSVSHVFMLAVEDMDWSILCLPIVSVFGVPHLGNAMSHQEERDLFPTTLPPSALCFSPSCVIIIICWQMLSETHLNVPVFNMPMDFCRFLLQNC
jgi:hypothetical protein